MKETSFKRKINKSIEKSIRNNIQSPLFETMKLFRSATNLVVNEPLTFDEWVALPDEQKSAALYVMFFNQITLAYYKSRSFYSPEEDNVSIVCQYLEKNVPIIKNNPRRYTPRYIYQVAYNCMFCQSRGIKRDLQRYETEISNKVITDTDEYDLFDYVKDTSTIDDIIAKERFWSIIQSMGDETVSVVENLINGTRLPAGVKAHKQEIIRLLQINLSQYRDQEF